MMLNRQELGRRLREMREAAGLQQTQVGRVSHIGAKSLSSFEAGKRSIRVSQLQELLSIYGVTEAEFFRGSARMATHRDAVVSAEAAMAIASQINELPRGPATEVLVLIYSLLATSHRIVRASASR